MAVSFALAPAVGDAANRDFAPWPEALPVPELRFETERDGESSAVKLPFLWGLWFYRNAISPLDGVRCGLYPTCSAYATEAIRTHGVLAGGFLAADRLIHESGVHPSEYATVVKHGRVFIHDPVERNDRLFRRAPAPAPAPEPRPIEPERTYPPPAALTEARAAADHAASLARTGDAYRAVGEWRRAAFLEQDPARSTALLVDAGFAAAAAGHAARSARPTSWTAGEAAFDEADRLFSDAIRKAETAKLAERVEQAELARATAHLARGWLPEASRRFEAVAAAGGDRAAEAAWLRAWTSFSTDLANGRASRQAADDRFAAFTGDAIRGESARGIIRVSREETWKRRSPGTAAALQFALPGAGYVYAGKPLVGVGSFLLNGAFIAGTVVAFRDGNYPLAVLLLSLETGWYVGGVNGAAQAAADRNEIGRRRYERGLRRRFLGGVWPGGAAGAILF